MLVISTASFVSLKICHVKGKSEQSPPPSLCYLIIPDECWHETYLAVVGCGIFLYLSTIAPRLLALPFFLGSLMDREERLKGRRESMRGLGAAETGGGMEPCLST